MATGDINGKKRKTTAKPVDGVLKQFHKKVPAVTLYQTCLSRYALSNKMVAGDKRNRKKPVKQLLFANQLMEFDIISQECSIGDSL